MTVLREAARRLLGPAIRKAMAHIPVDDPWEILKTGLSHDVLGPASRHPFSWYLEGESRVAASSLEQICAWLAACEFVADADLFRERDYWQHPLTFEQIRKGDCEDHALWGWRKMLELGMDARVVFGAWERDQEGGWAGHAWIEYTEGGTHYLVESGARDATIMVHPRRAARDIYVPCFSVDRTLRLSGHAGLIQYVGREDATADH